MKTVWNKVELTKDDIKEMQFFTCKHYDFNKNICTHSASLDYNDKCSMLHCQFFCKWYKDRKGD